MSFRDYLDWLPFAAVIGGGIASHTRLDTMVKSEIKLNEERYTRIEKSLEKLDQRQEDLIDYLLKRNDYDKR